MAQALGKTTDAQEYEKLADTTSKEFNQAWFVDGKYDIVSHVILFFFKW